MDKEMRAYLVWSEMGAVKLQQWLDMAQQRSEVKPVEDALHMADYGGGDVRVLGMRMGTRVDSEGYAYRDATLHDLVWLDAREINFYMLDRGRCPRCGNVLLENEKAEQWCASCWLVWRDRRRMVEDYKENHDLE